MQHWIKVSDGSFCYIPKGVRCPMELSTYFRINQAGTGQFENFVSGRWRKLRFYLEGCTAPSRDENHCMLANRSWRCRDQILTVQNWYPGNKEGKGGVFVTKRGICEKQKFLDTSWNRYPSVILKGQFTGEFYSLQ
jgi:Fe-S cluster assembly protein SufB